MLPGRGHREHEAVGAGVRGRSQITPITPGGRSFEKLKYQY